MMLIRLALFGVVLGWMDGLAPGREHAALAWAIATQSRGVSEAALVTAVAFRESTFRVDAIGDHGRSFCAMQIHSSSGGGAELLEDVGECVASGLVLLRQSVRIDRKHPVAWYARGPRWKSSEAQRLSNDRVAIARRLLGGEP